MTGKRLGWLLVPAMLLAQSGPLEVSPVPMVKAKRNSTVAVDVQAQLRSGFHVNSNRPNDEYLIPLELTWDAGPLEKVEVVYPPPKNETYPFSKTPVSVYSGEFKLQTKFKVKDSAQPGPVVISGKLRYQACTEKECLPPKKLPVTFTADIQ